MGTKFAPSYANLLMAMWEDQYIWSWTGLDANLVTWRRYIDDIIFIWKGTVTDLNLFLLYLDVNEFNLKFTSTVSATTINFLDLCIYVEDGTIKTKNYFKEVDANNYILQSSCHLNKWIENIPYGQYRRLKRNCTDNHIFEEQSTVLSRRFSERNYNKNVVDRALARAKGTPRESMLTPAPKTSIDDGTIKVPFVTQYNKDASKINKILNTHWPILKNDPVLGKHLADKVKMVYKKAPNIKNYLSPSALRNIPTKKHTWLDPPLGFYDCRMCTACQHSSKMSHSFKSNTTQKSYTIKQHLNCRTSFVIYLAECECGLQYIGKTTRPLRTRILEHLGNIKRKITTHSVSNHFLLKHNSNPASFTFKAIEQVLPHWRGGNRDLNLIKRESFWMFELKTIHPQGLNLEFDIKPFL
ncbi:uncharacterized protein LOC142470641 [Ascaphus truei]|uniref:uncharacterized protein LOC142470641 n=1 Tax=Ascaphus truei TaxID=8439 RepID=UPI003F59D81B